MWVSLNPAYRSRASSSTVAATSSGRRLAAGLPRFPCTTPSAPAAANRPRRRQAVRSLQPSSATASSLPSTPALQRARMSIRCWSRRSKVSLSRIGGD
jgi:hypothetical protein